MYGYSTQRRRGQSRLKSESQSNIGSKPKSQVSGPNTFAYRIGYASPRLTFEIMSLFLVLISLLSSITFNSEVKDITVASHNLHGFKTSSVYHKSCISNFGGIWFGQEHWLSNNQLPKLQQLDVQFVARSGMEDAVSAGILRGRPFGGVSIAWSRDLNHIITPLTDYNHKRVVAIDNNQQKHHLRLCLHAVFGL